MPLRLYNTASRKIETFEPKNPDEVKIYTCGPTVYSAPHIGNFAAYIYWDLLLRTLKANGLTPKRVLNLTDVGHLTSDGDSGEDKLEKGAKKEGKTVWEIADFYIDLFKTDFAKLRLLEPAVWARATDFITESEELVQRLIDRGFTYETSDGVYFDTSKFSGYADFARLDLENLKAGARVEFSSEKRNPSDFAVWKFIKPGENHAMRDGTLSALVSSTLASASQSTFIPAASTTSQSTTPTKLLRPTVRLAKSWRKSGYTVIFSPLTAKKSPNLSVIS